MYARVREKQRAGYVTSRQKRKLIELMTKHPQLIAFKATQDFNFSDSQRLWRDITNICNGIPGAKKTWRQWRKTWQDFRSNIKKKYEIDGEVPSYVTKLSKAEQEALGIKNLPPTASCQKSTEFVRMDMDNMQHSFDNNDNENDTENDTANANASLSENESLPEEKVFTHSQRRSQPVKSKREEKTHSDTCVFNCDMLATQEQRKLEIKEDYYSFKKDYLKQKLLLLKEQTEALKNIAKELAK